MNQFLQLEVEEKVFAIGDCCNTQEDKMAAFADKHGEVVATNIISQARGCPLTPYKRVGKLQNPKYFSKNTVFSLLSECWYQLAARLAWVFSTGGACQALPGLSSSMPIYSHQSFGTSLE